MKFATSNDVPDTPKLFFGEGPSCADNDADGKCDWDDATDVTQVSQFYLIGPGVKGSDKPIKAIEILGPNLNVESGKVKLVNGAEPIGFGFKTQQTYIYKREENDTQAL